MKGSWAVEFNQKNKPGFCANLWKEFGPQVSFIKRNLIPKVKYEEKAWHSLERKPDFPAHIRKEASKSSCILRLNYGRKVDF